MEMDDMNYVSRSIGQTLTLEERSALEVSLLKRKRGEEFIQLRLWGKIMGEKSDYIIAVGLQKSLQFPKKKFFFCNSSKLELQQFPDITENKRLQIATLKENLSGDPSIILMNENEDENDPTTICEVDRLLCMVEEIDMATSIVPCNAFLASATHEIGINRFFEGLGWEKALSLDSYYHLREPQSPSCKLALEKEGIVRSTDFLDPIAKDLQGSWVINYNNSKTTVIIRNLIYPGYVFFHEVETNKYGGAYFGNGLKNDDLPFMLS